MLAPMADLDHSALETLWRQRLNDARLRLIFARNYYREVRQDFTAGAISVPLERFAPDQAIRAERFALVEHARILAILTALALHGAVPKEDDWSQHKAAGEGE